MRRRVLLLLACVLLAAAPARAQVDPFQPPQPAVPTPEPTLAVPPPSPVPDPTDDGGTGLLFGIAGAAAVLLAGIAWFITRDARRNLTQADRRAVDRERAGEQLSPEQRKRADRAKQRARQKGRAQRQARKAQRRR